MKWTLKSTMNIGVRLAGILLVMGVADPVWAAPAGESVLAAHVGKVEARLSTESYHAGGSELKLLNNGQSVGEGAQLLTGKNGRACMVLSPGAVMCVAKKTQLTLRQLRHASDGLPKTASDLVRRIHIDLTRGRVLLHASTPSPTLDIEIGVPQGVVRSHGGTFLVAELEDGEWAVISESGEQEIQPTKGKRMTVAKGEAARLDANGARRDADLLNIPERKFEVCEAFFSDLSTFIEYPRPFDRGGLGQFITGQGRIDYVGPVDSYRDVSPSIPISGRTRLTTVPASTGAQAGGRWGTIRIQNWYEQVGAVKGVNYLPRNAVNSTEMWMENSFDPDILDEELGWAQDAGFTAVRVQLQFVAWKADPEGFMERFDDFLELADENGLDVVPVLFDDRNIAGQDPFPGKQPEPIPGKHDSRWMPSPGAKLVADRNAWSDLEGYVRDVMDGHKRDKRLLFWDLYNRPGDAGQGEASLPFMAQVFKWARDVDPKQPLATAVWSRSSSAMDSWMLEQSDIVTFQNFESADQVRAQLTLMKRYERPVICSDWLMRQSGNTFEEILPLYAVNHVGWFSHGLVNGKSQKWIQDAAYRVEETPDIWQHDMLESDGAAYDSEELRLIGEFKFQ
jgi:hypothetical protein